MTDKKHGRLHTAWKFFRPNYLKQWKSSIDDGGLRKEIFKGYRSLFSLFRKPDRNRSFPGTYEELLYCWGVNPDEVSKVARGLIINACLFFVYSAALLYYCIHYYLHGELIYALIMGGLSMGLFFVCLTRYWRASVLLERRLLPFSTWLRGIFRS